MGKEKGNLAAGNPVTRAMSFAQSVLFDWDFFWLLAAGILAAEAALGTVIVLKRPYTKIDWDAYMEEVEGPVVRGEFDYSKLRGETGPLVYPGGFVWLFGLLRWIAGGDGSNVRAAQWVFLGCYLATHACVLATYGLARPRYMPPAACLLLVLSKRLHSVYVLRLFNDCWSMLFLYAAVLLFALAAPRDRGVEKKQGRRKTEKAKAKAKERVIMSSLRWCFWALGCVLYSFAVSIKMNIFTFAPALLLLMLLAGGARFALVVSLWSFLSFASVWLAYLLVTLSLTCLCLGFQQCERQNIVLCALVQLAAGSPFLATFPVEYIRGAFGGFGDLKQKWTVNWKFLPESVFLSSPWFSLGLNSLLFVSLMAFFFFRWSTPGEQSAVTGSVHAELLCGAGEGPVLEKIGGEGEDEEGKATHAQVRSSKRLRSRANGRGKNSKSRSRSKSKSKSSARKVNGNKTTSTSTTATTSWWPAPLAGTVSAERVAATMFACNFVVMCFARSLHFQFYCWYFHALPLLLWRATALPLATKFVVFALLEYAWSYGLDAATGSSTPISSVALQIAHVTMLAGLWVSWPGRKRKNK